MVDYISSFYTLNDLNFLSSKDLTDFPFILQTDIITIHKINDQKEKILFLQLILQISANMSSSYSFSLLLVDAQYSLMH